MLRSRLLFLAIIAICVVFAAVETKRLAAIAPVVTLYPNGKIETITQLDAAGNIHGLRKHFSDSGVLTYISTWEHGVRSREASYWPSGRKKSESYESSGYETVYKSYPDTD